MSLKMSKSSIAAENTEDDESERTGDPLVEALPNGDAISSAYAVQDTAMQRDATPSKT